MNIKIEERSKRNTNFVEAVEEDASIARDRSAFGATYGIVAGVTFAIGLWGWDAIQLSQSHAFFPWMKLVTAILLYAVAGGITGWLAARTEKAIVGFLVWLAAAGVFSWIAIGLPLQIMPFLAKVLDPRLQSFLNYGIGGGYLARFWIAIIWIGIFVALTGVLQSSMVESAVFAISFFGRAAPFLACIVLMMIGGGMMDELINTPFRKAIFAVETPIQFILENRGLDIDPALSRKAHAGALRGVRDEVSEDRKLIVSSYDENFGQIHVLVRFADAWVDCNTIYGQASFCKIAEPISQ